MIASIVLNLLKVFGYPTLIIGEAMEGMMIPFPGETFLVTAAVYAGATHNLNIYIIVVFSTLGAFLGDNVGYQIGLRKGFDFVERHEKTFGLKESYLTKTQEYFSKFGSFTVFIGRFTALLRIFSPLLAGINKMNYFKFAVANFLGCLLWSIAYAYLGYTLGKDLPLLRGVLRNLGIGSTVIVIVLIGLAILYFYRKYKNK